MNFNKIIEELLESKAVWINRIEILQPDELGPKGVKELGKFKGPVPAESEIPFLISQGIIKAYDKKGNEITLGKK